MERTRDYIYQKAKEEQSDVFSELSNNMETMAGDFKQKNDGLEDTLTKLLPAKPNAALLSKLTTTLSIFNFSSSCALRAINAQNYNWMAGNAVASEQIKQLKKMNGDIENLLPHLNYLSNPIPTETTIKLKEKMNSEVNMFAAAKYIHILLSIFQRYINEIVEETPIEKGRTKENNDEKRIVLGLIYRIVQDAYHNISMQPREKENEVRKKTSDVLSACNIYVTGMSLITKGDRDRFWREIKKGLDKEKEFENDLEEFKSLMLEEPEIASMVELMKKSVNQLI